MTGATKRPRVLIAEDEPLILAIASEELLEAGFDVVTAADGDAAARALRADTGFDLLFTDIRMPGSYDGWAVASLARKLQPQIPVIYATGFSPEQTAMVERAVLLKKPYRVAAVLDAARQLGVLSA